MRLRRIIAAVALAGVLGGAIGLARAEGTDWIAKREAGMKTTAHNAKAISDALKAGADLAPLAPKAAEIAAWGRKIPSMFPPGSDKGKTEALPAIWTHKEDFDQHAAKLAAAGDKLAVAVKANDHAAAKVAFKAMGAACAGCHRSYREKKKH